MGADRIADDLRSKTSGNEPLVIEPENCNAVRLFIALQTQWLVHVASGLGAPVIFRTGLRYESVPIAAAALAITVDEDVFAALRTLESYALKFFGQKRQR